MIWRFFTNCPWGRLSTDTEVIGLKPAYVLALHSVDFWFVVPIFCLSCPFIWLWGLIAYFKAGHLSDWPSRASLAGLFAPIVSILYAQVLLVVVWKTGKSISAPPVESWFFVGAVGIPAMGMLIGLWGRPKLILAIVPIAVGTMLFWFFTTLP